MNPQEIHGRMADTTFFLVNTFCCLKLFDTKKRSNEKTEKGSNLLSKVLAEKVTKNYSSKNHTKPYFN